MVDYDALLVQRRNQAEWNIALHEAGHAMLADALGVQVSRVSIEGITNQCLDREGFCELPLKVGRCESLVIALAGRAVDDNLKEAALTRNWEVYETDDVRALEYLQSGYSDCDRANFLRLAPLLRVGWVADWVVCNRTQILAFADRLKTAKSLSGENLRTALDDSWGSERPCSDELAAEVQRVVTGQIEGNVPALPVSNNSFPGG
jgi:hypothetical protein